MLLNLSNHPSDRWSEKQRIAALEEYGEIRDLSFPAIPPDWDTKQVMDLTDKYLIMILKIDPIMAVHIQGEFTFSFALVYRLQKENIKCIVSTTRRIVDEEKDGTKISRFDFVRFREYSRIVEF